MEGKWKYISLSFCLLFILCLAASGCQPSDDNTKNESPVSISQSGFYVEEVSPNSYYVNIYCEYKNTSKVKTALNSTLQAVGALRVRLSSPFNLKTTHMIDISEYRKSC